MTRYINNRESQDTSTTENDKIHQQQTMTRFINNRESQDSSTRENDKIHQQDTSTIENNKIHQQDTSTTENDKRESQQRITRYINNQLQLHTINNIHYATLQKHLIVAKYQTFI